jgi:toxin ParE1/3/4
MGKQESRCVIRQLFYSQAAQSDIADIALSVSISAGDRAVGSQFAGQLRERCRQFASLPGMLGTARPELGQGFRSFPFKSYVIFFRYSDDRVEIINILSGRRDLPAYYDTGDDQ